MLCLTLGNAFLILLRFCTGQSNVLSDEFINSINEAQSSWTAAKVWPENTTDEFFDTLSGAVDPELYMHEYKNQMDHSPQFRYDDQRPKEFDARKKWPQCTRIGKARNQGKCGSCWAVAVAATASDRLCIAAEGMFNQDCSAEDILTCCESSCFVNATKRCEGGRVDKAWDFVIQHGTVTGGEYKSGEGCKPYSSETYDKGKPSACQPKCPNKKYLIPYPADKKRVLSTISFTNRDLRKIQLEIMENGPVVAHMRVFEDFYLYGRGVYMNLMGRLRRNYHAVKIIGWGQEDGRDYWLGVNSWGEKWGLKGLFKLLRGSNE
ncbi:Peptidase C1 and/or Propeptide C1 domain containing protein, partial [Asbolus verrucosus]